MNGLQYTIALLTIYLIYRNRWRILDGSIDLYVYLKKLRNPGPTITLTDRPGQLLLTGLTFRFYDSADALVKTSYFHLNAETGLDDSPNVNLANVIDAKEYKTLTDAIDGHSHTLVDIAYRYKLEGYLFTAKLMPNERNVPFYRSEDLDGKRMRVCFNDVSVVDREGICTHLDSDTRDGLIKTINLYLGPLEDFHFGLKPMKTEYMDLGRIIDYEKILLTTELLETVELVRGNYVGGP